MDFIMMHLALVIAPAQLVRMGRQKAAQPTVVSAPKHVAAALGAHASKIAAMMGILAPREILAMQVFVMVLR